MPHCCPQKQQCVFTKRSAGFRPNFSSTISGATASATGLLLQAQLGQRQRFPLAGRAQFLPRRTALIHLIVEAELRQNSLEVVNVHSRSVRFAATFALRCFSGCTRRLIELHAQLCGSLKNVEELPERQKEQRGNYGDRVQDRKKTVELAAQPVLRNRKRQPGYRNCKEQNDRQKIESEGLYRLRAAVPEPPPQRQTNTGKHENCGNVQPVKKKLRHQGVQLESLCRKSVHDDYVRFLIGRQRTKRNPPEHQRKRDRDRENTAPEQELVHPPAQCRTFADKSLRRKMRRREMKQPDRSFDEPGLPE